MKKFFSIFSVMAVIAAAMTFVSCSKDDDPVANEPTKPEETHKSVYYSLTVNEQYFEYGDVILTVNIDGEETTYSFLEKATKLDKSDLFVGSGSSAARVGEGTVVYDKSAQITPNFVLTEEGKKKIAAADPNGTVIFATSVTINNKTTNFTDGLILFKEFEVFIDNVNKRGSYNCTAN